MKSSELFSSSLLSARHKLQLSQKQMGERLGMGERQYIAYEQGDYDKKPKLVDKYRPRLKDLLDGSFGIPALKFPQKEEGLIQRITELETRMGKIEDLIDGLYKRLPAVPKQ